MKQKSMLKREYQNEQEWLKDIFRKSNSYGSRNNSIPHDLYLQIEPGDQTYSICLDCSNKSQDLEELK